MFTDYHNESEALHIINHIVEDKTSTGEVVKNMAKGILGDKCVETIKHFLKG